MKTTFRTALMAIYAIALSGALAFGVTQLSASGAAEVVDPIGTCPPLDPESCFDACVEEGYENGGRCELGLCICLH